MAARKFQEFKNMGVEEFVNSAIVKFEPSVLQAELDRCIKIKNEIEKDIYECFLENSGDIIQLLGIYEQMTQSALEYNKLADVYNETLLSFRMEEDFVYVDKQKQDELLNLFKSFTNDMACFRSASRYLLHFDVFSGPRDVLVILTNDLVFIAEGESKMEYKLLNAFSYEVVSIRAEEGDLVIESENSRYRLAKDEDSVSRVVCLYEELTFKASELPSGEDRGEDRDSFLVETEQYEKVERIRGDVPQMYSEEDLRTCLGKVDVGERSGLVIDFLNEKFRVGLGKINRIRSLESLIEHVFGYFWVFQEEQSALLDKIRDDTGPPGPKKALLAENQLGMVSEFLEKRMFYNFKIKANHDALRLIEKNLVRDGVDLRFLMIYFSFIKEEYYRECVKNAKRRLECIMKQMEAEYSPQ